MPADEDGDGQPSFWDLVEELGVVVTIPTFLIIVLQVTGSARPVLHQPPVTGSSERAYTCIGSGAALTAYDI